MSFELFSRPGIPPTIALPLLPLMLSSASLMVKVQSDTTMPAPPVMFILPVTVISFSAYIAAPKFSRVRETSFSAFTVRPGMRFVMQGSAPSVLSALQTMFFFIVRVLVSGS